MRTIKEILEIYGVFNDDLEDDLSVLFRREYMIGYEEAENEFDDHTYCYSKKDHEDEIEELRKEANQAYWSGRLAAIDELEKGYAQLKDLKLEAEINLIKLM